LKDRVAEMGLREKAVLHHHHHHHHHHHLNVYTGMVDLSGDRWISKEVQLQAVTAFINPSAL